MNESTVHGGPYPKVASIANNLRTQASPSRAIDAGATLAEPTNGVLPPYISRPGADRTGRSNTKDFTGTANLAYGQTNGQVALDKEAVYELVERAKEGATGAFEQIYKLYQGQLFKSAKLKLGKEAAEDAVAETFSRAWANLQRFRPTGAPFVAWLYGILRHVVADSAAAGRKVEPRAEFADAAVEPPLSTVELMGLYDAIAKLPKRQRQVIELKFLGGYTNDQVGGALGISPGAVNAKQWRAVEALKKIMDKK